MSTMMSVPAARAPALTLPEFAAAPVSAYAPRPFPSGVPAGRPVPAATPMSSMISHTQVDS